MKRRFSTDHFSTENVEKMTVEKRRFTFRKKKLPKLGATEMKLPKPKRQNQNAKTVVKTVQPQKN